MKPDRDDDVFTHLIESQEEHTSSKPFTWSSVAIPFLFPALGGFLFGYDVGATFSATISVKSASLSGTDWYNLSSVEIDLLESASLYGALLGSRLCRRKELIAAAGFYILGAAIQTLSASFGLLFLGRVVYGYGIGMIFSQFLLALYNAFVQGVPILVVIYALVHVGSYQVSYGPISWLFLMLIFSLRLKI